MPESLPQPILIVDSDEQSINHISSGLKDKGFLVITAPDGYDGYVRARNEAPKVIIVNDLLPYVSGFKLSKLIKSDDRHTDTKIVIMTNTTGPAIDKMFKYIDKDGSGSITFDEFATYMKRKKKKRQKSMKTTKMYSEKKLVQL